MARLVLISACIFWNCEILNTNLINGKDLATIFSQNQTRIPESCTPFSITVDSEIEKATIILQSNINSSNTVNCQLRLNPTIIERCIVGNIFVITPVTTEDDIFFECSAAFAVDVDYNGIVPHRSINIVYERQGSGPGEQKEVFQRYTVKVNIHTVADVSGKYTFYSILHRDMKLDIFLRIKSKQKILFNEGDTLSAWKDKNHLVIPCRAYDREIALTLAEVVNDKEEEYQILNNSSIKHDPEIGFSVEIGPSNSSNLVGKEYICWRSDSSNAERRNVFVKFTTEILTGQNEVQPRPVISFPSSTKGAWNEAAYCDSNTSNSVNFINILSTKRTESILKSNCLRGSKDYDCEGKKDSVRDWTRTRSKFRIVVEVWHSGLLICTLPKSGPTTKEYFVGFDKNIHTELRTTHISPNTALKIEIFQFEASIYDRKPVEHFFSGKDYQICVYFIEYIFMYYNYPLCHLQNAKNQTLKKVEGKVQPQNNFEGFSFWIFTVNFPNSEVNYVTCSVAFWNYQLRKLDSMNITKNIRVNDRVKPKILIENTNYSEIIYVRVLEKSPQDSEMVIPNQNPSHGTNYGLLVGLPISVTIVVFGVVVIVLCYYMQRLKKKNLIRREEVDLFFLGDTSNQFMEGKGDSEYIPNIPYDEKYEISDEHFKIDKEDVLGSGQFGIVYKGVVHIQPVAVKTVSKFAKADHVKALLSELKLLIYIGEHPNILALVGAHTRSISKGLVYMFVELCPLGSLENHIRKNRSNFIKKEQESRYCNTHDSVGLDCLITVKDLINWSFQTTNAMEFLSSKNVIHGDLATRNILLFDRSWIKVTDFGLSRKLYEYTNYVKKSQEPLPWRWLAIESLKDMHFSSKTDVWSFGVTAWEIFSLGEVPYGGLSWNLEFPNKLKKGLRLLKPEYASDEIYEMLKQCWLEDPKKRPQFSQLTGFFQSLLSISNADSTRI